MPFLPTNLLVFSRNHIAKIENEMQQKPNQRSSALFFFCWLLFGPFCHKMHQFGCQSDYFHQKNNNKKALKSQQKSNIYIHLTTHKAKNDTIFEMLWIEPRMQERYSETLNLAGSVGLGNYGLSSTFLCVLFCCQFQRVGCWRELIGTFLRGHENFKSALMMPVRGNCLWEANWSRMQVGFWLKTFLMFSNFNWER